MLLLCIHVHMLLMHVAKYIFLAHSQASNFSAKYWSHLQREPTIAEIEKQYWHIVEGAEENVQVFVLMLICSFA